MADNIIKKIKTSCPFPMLEYKAKVRYNEVRKASGIAFILLELIQKSVMGKEKVVGVLLRFGIPKELHYIFAGELSSLIANEIIKTDTQGIDVSNMRYFEQMTLDMFSLSEKGRKIFAGGAIPTGQEKAKTPTVFYSPVTRSFMLVCTQSYAPLATSFLGADFLEKLPSDVTYAGDTDMEDYFRSVQTKIGLKIEEMIVKVECDEPRPLAAKAEDNLTITVAEDGISFDFATSDETDFFKRYYSGSLMTSCMLAKEKYKFSHDVPTVEWDSTDVNSLYIPADLQKQASCPCKLFLNRSRFGISRSDSVLTFEGDNHLLMLDENAEFALLDSKECKYYLPVNIRFHCETFDDTFEMQFLVEKVASPAEYEQLLQSICEDLYEFEYTPNTGAVLSFIALVLKDPEYLNGYASSKIAALQSREEQIEFLLQLNSAFARCEGWDGYFKSLSERLFSEYVATTELDSVIYKNTVLLPLVKAMDMSELDYIQTLGSVLKEKEADELVYQALESAGFGEKEILSVVNVIGDYMKCVLKRTPIDSPTSLAGKFSVLQFNLWELCDMLGIASDIEYTLKDDYNVDSFFDVYTTLEKAAGAVEKYTPYAKDEFARLTRYREIFAPIHEILSAERTASEHPEKITSKFIDEQISRGRYSVAISNLLIKAQYDLRRMLSADSSLKANELIDEAFEKGFIKHDRADALHKLRMCRNGLQHPEASQVAFNEASLREWKKIVFSLKGDK